MPKIEPTKASTAKMSKPQVATPRKAGDPPPKLTDAMCPTCHKDGTVRRDVHPIRIGEHRISQCRQGHVWSPKGGETALKMLAVAREKMRVARAKVAARPRVVEDLTN